VLTKKGNKKYGNTLKRVAHLCKQMDRTETEIASLTKVLPVFDNLVLFDTEQVLFYAKEVLFDAEKA
jgi:hypothetical protein